MNCLKYLKFGGILPEKMEFGPFFGKIFEF
jgi:hypothetical protein